MIFSKDILRCSLSYDSLEYLPDCLYLSSISMPPFTFNRRWAKAMVSVTMFTLILLLYYRVSNRKHLRHEINLDAAARSYKLDAQGFMSLSEAGEYCKAHNWKAYPKRSTHGKIYDLFMINTELDWLEIRLNELKDQVDYFVILESATTFTGLPKPLHLKDNWEHFSAFHGQIIYRDRSFLSPRHARVTPSSGGAFSTTATHAAFGFIAFRLFRNQYLRSHSGNGQAYS